MVVEPLVLGSLSVILGRTMGIQSKVITWSWNMTHLGNYHKGLVHVVDVRTLTFLPTRGFSRKQNTKG